MIRSKVNLYLLEGTRNFQRTSFYINNNIILLCGGICLKSKDLSIILTFDHGCHILAQKDERVKL